MKYDINSAHSLKFSTSVEWPIIFMGVGVGAILGAVLVPLTDLFAQLIS